MPRTPEIFLDTSALFAGVWLSQGGGRLLLKLGETGIIQLKVCSQVLVELERAVCRKAPDQLPNLAVLLEQSGIDVVAAPSDVLIETCQRLIGYENDARVLAAAWSAECSYFVTLDKHHFLDNEQLHSAAAFPLGTPGDCLAWIRQRLSA